MWANNMSKGDDRNNFTSKNSPLMLKEQHVNVIQADKIVAIELKNKIRNTKLDTSSTFYDYVKTEKEEKGQRSDAATSMQQTRKNSNVDQPDPAVWRQQQNKTVEEYETSYFSKFSKSKLYEKTAAVNISFGGD